MQCYAVLTSGGDSPGMNTVVAAAARSAAMNGLPLVGVIRGYNGVIRRDDELLDAFFTNAQQVITSQPERELMGKLEDAVRKERDEDAEAISKALRPLIEKYRDRLALCENIDAFLARHAAFQQDLVHISRETILDIHNQAGSYLRTARCDDFRRASVRLRALVNLTAAGIDGLIVIGGDGSFQGATLMCQIGMPCIGIPGTIDNDLAYTEMTLGYDTAVNVAMKAVLQIRSTSRAHDRPHVVEVMGRDCGDIALRTAMASGAEVLVVREAPWRVEQVAERVQREIDRGNYRATVIVAEGAYTRMEPFDAYSYLKQQYKDRGKEFPADKYFPGMRMTAYVLAEVLKYMCRMPNGQLSEARATILGYTQRGEMPTAYDAAFAVEAGNMAVSLLIADKQDLAIGVRDGHVYSLVIDEAFARQKTRDERFNRKLYDLINSL